MLKLRPARSCAAASLVILVAAAACSSAQPSDLFPSNDAGWDVSAATSPGDNTEDPDATPEEDATARCAAGEHRCGGECVPIDDPQTGCGASNCSPCVIAHGSPRCESGLCAIAYCERGRADCNGEARDGCEVDITSDPSHCGSCTAACGTSQVCAPSGCSDSCGSLANCNGACVDLTSDPEHCGWCGGVCSAPPHGRATCYAQSCDFECDAGYARCTSGCCRNDGRDAGSDAGDATMVCASSCTSDFVCQVTCPQPGQGVNCCDRGLGICYVSQTSSCPAPPGDSGPVGPY